MKYTKKRVQTNLCIYKSPSKKLQFLYSVESQLKHHSTNPIKQRLTSIEKELLNFVQTKIKDIESNRKSLEGEYEKNKLKAIELTEEQKKQVENLLIKPGKEAVSVESTYHRMNEILGDTETVKKKPVKRGRKIDNEAAPQDKIESSVKKLIEKGGKYLNKNNQPKPTTIRNEIIKDPSIQLGERQLFNRVKKALKNMQ